MPKKDEKIFSNMMPDLAFKAGLAFYNSSLDFFQKVTPNEKDSQQRAADHHAELIVSATNLAFAIELLLKTCYLVSGVVPKEVHDLFSLYNELPNKKIKDDIENVYAQLCKQTRDKTTSFIIALKIGEMNHVERDNKAENLDKNHHIEAVLKRVKGDFLFWRYFFEKGSAKEVKVFKYEFLYMQFIFIAIRAALLNKFNLPH